MQGPITWTYHKIKEQFNRCTPAQNTEKPISKAQPCPHRSGTDFASKCETCIAEKTTARKYRWKVLLLLLPGFFLSSLDMTVVATALPFIASHFDQFNQLNWIVTAFTLTSCAFIPLFGQLADIFGRYVALQFSLSTLTIGSILCAAAPAWAVLLLGRGLQGVGTAGLANVSMIILADRVSLKEQAVNTSIFQFLIGIGYSTGPVIGGYLTNVNWRYIFVLCAGLGAISMVAVFFLRNDLKPGETSLFKPGTHQPSLRALLSGCATVDCGGAFLFIVGVGLIILGTAWGGSSYPWKSVGVIVPLVVGALTCVAFIFYERALQPGKPLARIFPRTTAMIPFDLIAAKDITLVCIIAAATGAAMFAAFYFIGIYFTLVEGYDSGKSGLQLLFYVPGIGVGSYTAMIMCNAWPRQTFWPLIMGTVIETAGMGALTYATKSANRTLVNVMMAIAGFGSGIRLMPEALHLAGMFRNRVAPVLSMLRFAMPFGGTLAITVMGAVFQNKMSQFFALAASQNLGVDSSTLDLHNTASLDALTQASPEVQARVRAAGADAVMWAFISILPFLGLSLVANLFLGNVWISKHKKTVDDDVEMTKETVTSDSETEAVKNHQRTIEERDGLPDVLNGVYLWAVLTRRVKAQRHPGPAEDEPFHRRPV